MNRFSILCGVLAIALGAGLAPSSAHSQTQGPVYRWVDAQGKVHYGDKASAPRGTRPFQVQVAGPASDRQYLSGGAVDTPTSDAPPGPAPDPSPAQVEEDEAVRQACQVARRNRDLLADESQNVLNDEGTQVLSAAARAQRLARVEREIEAYCNVLADGEGHS